jgi:hypothetical protein
VGSDVHKATIAISVAAAGRDGEVRHLGRLENRPRWSAGWSNVCGGGVQELPVCYEAGPCGYGPAPAADRAWMRLRGGGAGSDSAASGRPGQDRPPGRDGPGGPAS